MPEKNRECMIMKIWNWTILISNSKHQYYYYIIIVINNKQLLSQIYIIHGSTCYTVNNQSWSGCLLAGQLLSVSSHSICLTWKL